LILIFSNRIKIKLNLLIASISSFNKDSKVSIISINLPIQLIYQNFIQYLSLTNYFLLNIFHLSEADISKVIRITFLTVQIKAISTKSIKINKVSRRIIVQINDNYRRQTFLTSFDYSSFLKIKIQIIITEIKITKIIIIKNNTIENKIIGKITHPIISIQNKILDRTRPRKRNYRAIISTRANLLTKLTRS
jgi:hypothetical protein